MKPCSSVLHETHFRYHIGGVGNLLSVSGDPLSLLGYDAQAFLAGSVDLAERIHAGDIECFRHFFEGNTRAGSANLRVRQANGRIRCVYAQFLCDTLDGQPVLELILQDAGGLSRNRPVAALDPMIRAMMDNTDDFIFFKDRHHVFTGASQSLAELCGYRDRSDLIGLSDYDVFPESYADRYYLLEQQVFAGLPVARKEQEILHPDGRSGWVDNRKYPIFDASGEIVGLYGIARDITGQHKLESDLLAIADFVSQDHGERFLDVLTEFSATLFEVDYVHVALLESDGLSVRVVAGYCDGKPVAPGYVYALRGTPCEHVVELDRKCYSRHVQAQFPSDRDLQTLRAEAYIGEPIVDQHGKAIGLMVLVSRQPKEDSKALIAGMRILAERASTDLQQRRAAADLQRQRETLKLILDLAPIGIWLQDGKGKMAFVNKAFCQATGIPEERFLAASHYADLIPPEFSRECLASDALALERRGVSITQQRLPFADGQVHDLQVIKATKRNEAGAVEALVGISRDVTEELHREKLLKASEQRFRSLFEQMPNIAVQGYDTRRQVIYWNAASEALYGYSAAEALGRNLEDLIVPDFMRQGVIDAVTAWTNDGVPIPAGELVLRRKDGSAVSVFSSHALLINTAGEPEMYCIDVDLTDLKKKEAELRAYQSHLEDMVSERARELLIAKDAAEAANRAKSAFLANMSHELRTPMNGVMGMMELAKRHMIDPKGRVYLDKAKGAADNLLAVLNDILDLSKIEADRLALEELPLHLSGVFDNLIGIMEHRASDKGLTLSIELPPALAHLPLQGDPLRLGQILLNLVGNAIKFTERGDVTVRAGLVEETVDSVRVRFTVTDTGIGIDPAAQARLFQSFEQADNTTTRKYGGTGLGLAICKRLVLIMGGEIGAESAPGQGSTFWFVVPLKRRLPAPPPLPSMPSDTEIRLQRGFSGIHVLLAEDEPISREIACCQLEAVGFRVDLAEDGLQALELARRNRYAVILMDVQMPVMNGLESARAIRADSLNMDTPVLAMTANAYGEDQAACLAAGMNEHIAKPVDPEKLYRALLEWLGGEATNVLMDAETKSGDS